MTNLKELTKGMIFYSSTLSDFEKLDFRNDALAGVRANYFNSNKHVQADETEITIQDEVYKLSYKMSDGHTLSWKVTKNHRPYQSVKRETGGIYCVKYYGNNGNIYKRQYFDINHLWIRTEYYNRNLEGELVCTISPKRTNGILVIEKIKFTNNIKSDVKILFPSETPPQKSSDALVYTNCGMIWYDESFKPDNFFRNNLLDDKADIANTFGIKPELFEKTYTPQNVLNLSTLEYLEEINVEDETAVEPEVVEAEEPENYSAYDRIEKILREANKTNRNLFGEILEHTEEIDISNDPSADSSDKTDDNVLNIDNCAVEIPVDISDTDTDSDCTEELAKTSDISQVLLGVMSQNTTESDIDIEETEIYEPKQSITSDFLVETQSGVYSYFGATDENGKRTGRGRTESPQGYTAYDGEYNNDKREGFGVFYYKNGDINYVGDWSQNKRNGCGVGYRTSDGTMHIGKWKDNKPDNIGARFDKSGNFIDLAFYEDGIKNGKSVSIDENGNFVLAEWKNGEKISERIIE